MDGPVYHQEPGIGIRNSEGNHTLLSVLDNTVSPMGARLLKRWIVFPLKDIQKINERLELVEFFIKETDLRNKIITSNQTVWRY